MSCCNYLWMMLCSLFFLSPDLSGQVFTVDFLTYSDYDLNHYKTRLKGRLTSYVFFGENEFDQSGSTPYPEISYQEFYLTPTMLLFSRTKFELSLAPQFSMLLDGISVGSASLGAPWLWAKAQFFENLPITARLGFKWEKQVNNFWITENELDLGFLAGQNLNTVTANASVSYRFKGKSDQGVTDFDTYFDQRGNELHYKLEISKAAGLNNDLSLLVLGYHSGNKKLGGMTLPNSYSRKISAGACYNVMGESKGFSLGVLIDIAGRYDKKGFLLMVDIL